jgi:hypothetical protein
MSACSTAESFADQRERREPATDVRLDGDEMTADPDDGDAGHPSRTYIPLDPRFGEGQSTDSIPSCKMAFG